MPIMAGSGSPRAQLSDNRRTLFEKLAPYALAGNIKTSFGEEILHISIA